MKKLTALLLAALMLLFLCACTSKDAPVTDDAPENQTSSQPVEDKNTAAENSTQDVNPETEPETEPEVTPEESPRTLTVSYEQPFSYDWDKDGSDEVFTWGENAISNEGVLTVHFESDMSRDAIIETPWLIYDGMIAFTDLDGDGTEEVFLTGSDGTYNFVTYAFRMENGTLTPMPLAPDPALPRTTPLQYVPGCLQDTLDENGNLQIAGVIDLLGTFSVTRPYHMADGAFSPVLGVLLPFDMENAYPCTLIADLPCTFTNVPNEDVELTDADTMSAYSVVAMTGVRYEADGSAAAFFSTGDGMCGAFRAVPVEGTYGYSWTVGGLQLYEAFESLPFMG